MALIKGKQLADSTITSRELKLDSGTFDFSSVTLQANTPSNATDVANKSYVDSVTSGSDSSDFKESVFVATTGNLAASYSNKVLTASSNGALSIDGKSPSANQRVLVKDQTTQTQNGIYTVTTAGDGSNAFVLTRAADADSSSDLSTGALVFVETGTDNKSKRFALQSNSNGSSPTLDTNDLVFIQVSGASQIVAGAGLAKSGDTLSAALPKVDALTYSGAAITADDTDTTLDISSTPAGDSHVRITVNGVGIKLADGSKTSGDAFFSDGAGGARAIADIQANDSLFWNGDSTNYGSYSIDPDDVIEIFYNA